MVEIYGIGVSPVDSNFAGKCTGLTSRCSFERSRDFLGTIPIPSSSGKKCFISPKNSQGEARGVHFGESEIFAPIPHLVAFTIATIPARTASGRRSHRSKTSARSREFSRKSAKQNAKTFSGLAEVFAGKLVVEQVGRKTFPPPLFALEVQKVTLTRSFYSAIHLRLSFLAGGNRQPMPRSL